MEVIKNETSGRYTITLGGIVWNNCTADADCPGRGLCAVNQTWSEYPSMCFCNFVFQHQGADCGEVGSYGMTFFIILLLASLAALVGLIVSIVDLYKLVSWGKFKRDALSTSLIITILALAGDVIITAAVNRFAFLWLPIDRNGYKDDHLLIGTIGMSVEFFFISLSLLNVSLVWIQIADNAEKVRKSGSKNISRYRNFLIAFYIVFLGAMIAATAMGNATLSALITAPSSVFVLITYMYGGFRMRKMSKAYLSSDGKGPDKHQSASTSSNTKNLRDSLKLIQYAALTVSFVGFNFLLTIGIWALLGAHINSPEKPVSRIVFNALFWFWSTMGPVSVMAYLHAAITRKDPSKVQGLVNENGGAVVAATEVTKTPAASPKTLPPKVAPEKSGSRREDSAASGPMLNFSVAGASDGSENRGSTGNARIEPIVNDLAAVEGREDR